MRSCGFFFVGCAQRKRRNAWEYQCQDSPSGSIKHNFHSYDNDAKRKTKLFLEIHKQSFLFNNATCFQFRLFIFSFRLLYSQITTYTLEQTLTSVATIQSSIESRFKQISTTAWVWTVRSIAGSAANDSRHNPLITIFFSAPNFVGSFTFGDFVYFFFRETAVEFINCGKVYSRKIMCLRMAFN